MLIKLTKFLFGAVITQGIGAISGLLFARWMKVDDYAIFTVMLMVTGAMTILTKGGAHLGFTAILGRTWPNKIRAAQALKAANRERRIISLFILPPLLFATCWLLAKNNAPIYIICILILLLVLNWEFDMRTRMVDQILLFAGKANTIQRLDACLSLVRLAALLIIFYYSLLNPISAVGLTVLIAFIRVPFIIRWTKRELAQNKIVIDNNDSKEIRKITRRQLPLEVFFVLQSQIVFAILAWFSASEQTASVGALSRIGQLLLPVQSMLQAFAIPNFTSNKKNIFTSWLVWSIACFIPGLTLVGLSFYFPEILLFLIGPNYANLKYELFIVATSSALSTAIGSSLQLIAHRGWNYYAWLQIPIVVAWCVLAPFKLDLTRLDHVLWFQTGLVSGIFFALIAELLAAWRRGDFSPVNE